MFRSVVGVAGRMLSPSSQNIIVKSVSRGYCKSINIGAISDILNFHYQYQFQSYWISLPASAPKRFYKNAGILSCDGKFEITLDNKKLRTPSGGTFYVTSEPLAIAGE